MAYIPDFKPINNNGTKISEVKGKRKVSEKEELNIDHVFPEDKVEISKNIKDVKNISSSLARMPEIREERIKELKKDISKGTYNVKGEKIAEKIIKEALLSEIV